MIPLLEVLFNQVDYDISKKIVNNGEFSFSIEYLKTTFYRYFSEIIQSSGRKEALKFVCLIILLSVFLANIFKYLSSLIIAKVRVRVVTNIRNSLFEKIINFRINFFTNEKKGDVISRLTSDIQQIENSVINSVTVLFKEPALLLGLFFILSTISIKLTVYTLVLIPVSGFIISNIAKHLKVKAAFSQTALGNINNIINETLDGIRIIKLFTANSFMKNRFGNEVTEYGRQNYSMYKRFELSNPVSEFLGIVTVSIILLVGGGMVLDSSSDITASEFIAFIIIFSQVLPPAKAITGAFNTIQRGVASADRVFEFIDKDKTDEEDKGKESKETLNNSIEFENVSFAYENDNVLNKVSFKINRGESVAIVGPSGGGKSTIIDLLSKFYTLKNGSIKIDGENIKKFKTDDIRKMIGIVTQESLLFHDTIKNNICFGSEKYDYIKLKKASEIANAYDFIEKLDKKYDTIIGERGLKLSGGQRQRICIARAIYKDPPILIFDEATSSLDSKSEKSVQTAVEKVMKDRTTIIIAHRLSTIKNVDKIIVIDKGQIVETGSHEELIKKNNMYYNLSKMQNLS
ncbi:MAG: ABC transporter ATP-binding protein [Flammeovirgaceae bacterium]